MFIIGF